MTSRLQFSPLCDIHHTPMLRVMLEEEPEEIGSYHACERHDCTRIFHESRGYLDRSAEWLDDSRIFARRCPACGSILYLAEVDHAEKIETWECTLAGCDESVQYPSPAAR